MTARIGASSDFSPTRLTLTTRHFEQTQGNEKHARPTSALNDEIARERRDPEGLEERRLQEEADRAQKEIDEKIEAPGCEGDEEKAVEKLEVEADMAEYMPQDSRGTVSLGTRSAQDEIDEMDTRRGRRSSQRDSTAV